MNNDKKKCPYCGEEIMASAKKCRYCGEWLVAPNAVPQAASAPQPTPTSAPQPTPAPQTARAAAPVPPPVQVQPAVPPTPPAPPVQEAAEEDSDEYSDDKEPRSFFDAYLVQPYIRQFADFSGRSTRKEFWFAYLAYFIACIGLTGLVLLLGAVVGFMGLMIGYAVMGLVCLAATVPFLALSCRRLRDAGKSPWLTLLLIVPAIGPLVLLFMWCAPTDHFLDDEADAEATEPEPVTMKLSDWAILGGCLVVFVFSIILSGASLAGLAGGDSGYDLGDGDAIEPVEVINEWDMDTTEEYVVATADELVEDEDDMLGARYRYYADETRIIPIEVSSPEAFQGYGHEYGGMRGRYCINMWLDLEKFTGRGSRMVSEQSQYFELRIFRFNPDSRRITILELETDDDVITGKYDGVISPSGTKIEGWYTGLDGEQSQFTVELCDAP